MRSKRVELILDTVRAQRGAKDLTKTTDGVAASLAATAKQGDRAAKAVDTAGDEMSEAARAAASLDRQVEQLTGSLRELALAQALTGNDFSKQMRQQETQIRRLSKNRNLLGDPAEQASGFVARLSGRLGPLLASMPLSGPVGIAVAAAGAAAAPLLGASVAAGIIGGAGVGGVIGGLALARKDERVQTEIERFGKSFGDRMDDAAGVFVGPALAGLRDIEAAAKTVDIEGIFRDSARYVPMLSQGVSSAVTNLGDGVEKLVRNAGPVVEQISENITELSDAVGDGLEQISDKGPQAASALNMVFETVEFGTRSTFNLIDALSTMYGWWEKINGDPAFKLMLKAIGMEMDTTNESSRRLGSGTFELKGSIDAAAGAARGEVGALEELSKELRAQTDPAFALLQAQGKLKTAQDKAAEATRKHGRNSVEAREATRNLAMAALDMQARAGSLAKDFNGRLTPSMVATYRAAGLTESQINDVERELGQARSAADKYAGSYKANVTLTGDSGVRNRLDRLLIQQQALKKGIPVSSAAAAFNKNAYAAGGPVHGPGTKTSDSIPALLSNNEHVWTADEVSAVGGHGAVKRLRESALAGELPAFARGGAVWPFPTTAAMTRVPSYKEAMSVVAPPGPSGGATGPWMERLLEKRFGVNMISGFRPGSRTRSGTLSYHARNRAVDFPPMLAMARFMYQNYKPRLKEAITPYQQYNVHNGRDRRWSGAVWNQHNFAGGNAHNHFAMLNGGMIREPVVGVGRSGATYSFAENGRPERVVPAGGSSGAPSITVHAPITIAGANQSVEQIADAVSRKLGRQISIMTRGV